MEDQIMSMEIVRKGDGFSVSEVASRLKVSNRDARITLEELEKKKLLISEIRKNYLMEVGRTWGRGTRVWA